jgi:dihydrolipoamide dehydrogenase
MMSEQMVTEVVVIGSGPGGYTAAFRAADLGKKVTLVEYYDTLGGVCLNVGCIPSKALLHAAKVLTETHEAAEMGISFAAPKVDLKQLRSWTENKVVKRLTGGLGVLAKQRKVTVVNGKAEFVTAHELNVTKSDGSKQSIKFDNAIIAVGSSPIRLPFLPDDPRIMDSTGALLLDDLPKELLVIGGGIIGMELGTVYDALGSKVTVVELTEGILPGVDKDLSAPLLKRMQKRFSKILLNTKVTKVEAKKDGLYVTFEGAEAPAAPVRFDKILSCVGRAPNGKAVQADKAGVKVDERGFIPVDKQQRTNIAHIFAIGDVVGNPMLAHKAMPEGKVAAEVIAGKKHFFEPRCIPNVAYTDPEVAWVGVTEQEAKAKGLAYDKGVFPWLASGRALSLGREEGLTKVIIDKASNRIIGAGIVGTNAGDLIAEATLAIEMGCDVEDVALTIHPHPTLSETICQATEIIDGTITDMLVPKK